MGLTQVLEIEILVQVLQVEVEVELVRMVVLGILRQQMEQVQEKEVDSTSTGKIQILIHKNWT